MKLSLAWIFDHLLGSWKDFDINDIVNQCTLKVAEIDQCQKITTDLSAITLVRVIDITSDAIKVLSPEWNKEFEMPVRSDAEVGSCYLAKKSESGISWVLLTDWHSAKDGLVPAVHVDDMAMMGSWKDAFEVEDYILEIDNVAITNRPDLWCHRGFAREIGAFLNIPLKPLELLLSDATVESHEHFSSSTASQPFSFEIQDQAQCKRFAGLYFSSIACRPSSLLMAHRLAKVDVRPINTIVDITNFVTFDMSQPLHAFDAKKIHGNKLIQRCAKAGETVTLLDGQTIELTPQNLIVADAKKPVALAGIMGGKESGVHDYTNAIVLEAANYQASAIRKTSTQYKIRSEASARFEKSLDPNQNVLGILRFVKLLEDEKVPFATNFEIQSLGKEVSPLELQISHAEIESKVGVTLSKDFIVATLTVLEFGVTAQDQGDGIMYSIVVPTFRSTKDVTIPEDIIEEVSRFYGYSTIPLELPAIPLNVSDLSRVTIVRAIKQQLAFGSDAYEVQNYPCFDEQFLTTIKWSPDTFASLKNPISENAYRLVTSLIPHLCKNITQNTKESSLRFFEMNSTWQRKNDVVKETLTLSGIFYAKDQNVSFIDIKQQIQKLCAVLKVSETWHKPEIAMPVWCHPYQTAVLKVDDTIIGYAGKIDPTFFLRIADGDAFIFEFDMDTVFSLKKHETAFKPLAKYPETSLDISMLVPLTITVQDIVSVIKNVDNKIVAVDLLDVFQKPDWVDQKSVTCRFIARDENKTLEKQEIDALYNAVASQLTAKGIQIR